MNRYRPDGAIRGQRLPKAVNDEIQVDNAGIILTASLLPQLFEMNALLHEGTFKGSEEQTIARQLLNYVSYAQQPVQSTQPLTNVLCSSEPLSEFTTVNRLSREATQSAVEMLQALIQHWNIGNTSIEGLRDSFIQRAGVLQKLENGWKLAVEPSAFDVLLDRFPWSTSIVKLHWMEEPLYVSWR